MAQLRQDHQEFVDRQSEIIAVGPEDKKAFADWWHAHHMPFTGIPDPSHVLAKLYSQKVKWIRGGRLPALMVIDKRGDVRLEHYADMPSDIPTDEVILSLLDELNKEVPV